MNNEINIRFEMKIVCYLEIRCAMICLLSAIWLTLGGSIAVHIYTQIYHNLLQ